MDNEEDRCNMTTQNTSNENSDSIHSSNSELISEQVNIEQVDIATENSRQSANVIINNDDLTFINNKKVKKYLISDYFQRVISNREVNLIAIVTKSKTKRNEIEENVEQTAKTIQSIKNKMYVQQHIVKIPRANDTWGSSIDTANVDSIRLYFQNINGLLMGSKADRWSQHVEMMQRIGCDISGLAESNTNWNNTSVIKKINKIGSNYYQNISSSYSDNRFQPDNVASYLPGGNIQTCVNHWTGRILKEIKDPRRLGRWSGHMFRLKDQKTLTVITAYRPCKQSNTKIKLESRTAFNQQIILLRQDGMENANPRNLFIADMLVLIKDLEKLPDNYIILMIDANEDVNDKERGVSSIIEQTSLVDVFTEHTMSECNIATYARGTKRIDYIFTSLNVIPFVERVGYTAFYSLNTSDHRGLFIDLSQSLIDNKVELKRPPARSIGTKFKGKDLFHYKEEINKQFINHRIYERSNQLHEESRQGIVSRDFENKLNSIDKEITEIMVSAENKKCRRRHVDSEWSVELHITSLMCLYWMKQYKGLINGVLVTKQLKTIWDKLNYEKKNEINMKTADLSNQQLLKISQLNMTHYLKYKRELLRHAKELRLKGLHQLKEIRLAEGKTEKAVIIQKIYNNEMTKHDWSITKSKFNPTPRSRISSVEVPDKDAYGNVTDNPDKAVTWKRITDPVEVENKLLERNIKHFGQAEGTLFTLPEFQNDFQYEGVSE